MSAISFDFMRSVQPRFLTPLKSTPLGDGRNSVLDFPLVFRDADRTEIEAPTDFVTDFASIPPLPGIAAVVIAITHALIVRGLGLVVCVPLFWFAVFVCLVSYGLLYDARLEAPAVIHDYLFRVVHRGKWWGWIKANGVLWRAMKANGYPRFYAWLVFAGVTLGGGFCWRQDKKK